MNSPKVPGDLYKSAGVDADLGDKLVEWLQGSKTEARCGGGEIVSGIGGFAALFRPRWGAMKDPLLVSGTDGVGTKVLLGLEHGKLQGLGIDLVAMCANDVFTVGARSLFFLDYYATGTLDSRQFKDVLTGIREGCRQCEAILLGGETAELPGLYARGHFDLAGFHVGIVDAPRVLGASRVKTGDRLYALPSSGFHSNGYSLVRKWLREGPGADNRLIDSLLAPTKIYGEIPELLERTAHVAVHALAHITGGGISGNLPRVLPDGTRANISWKSLPTPSWMKDFILRHTGSVSDVEEVFNLGAGMIAAVAREHERDFETAAGGLGLAPVAIGEVGTGDGPSTVDYHDRG